MLCDEARTHLLDRRRGKLDPVLRAAVETHLESCDACRADDLEDAALSDALERLPKPRVPESLVRDLRARHGSRSDEPRRRRFVAVAIGALAVAAAVALVVWRRPPPLS